MARTLTNLLHHGHGTLPGAGLRFTDLVDAVLTWVDVARERRHLASLDDRMLSDAGLNRADVERESSRPFWDVGKYGG